MDESIANKRWYTGLKYLDLNKKFNKPVPNGALLHQCGNVSFEDAVNVASSSSVKKYGGIVSIHHKAGAKYNIGLGVFYFLCALPDTEVSQNEALDVWYRSWGFQVRGDVSESFLSRDKETIDSFLQDLEKAECVVQKEGKYVRSPKVMDAKYDISRYVLNSQFL